jgi:MFS family permease
VAIGASAGFFFSPIYTGWRADMLGNWRTPIIELGALGIVMAAIFQWLAEEERGSARITHKTTPAEKLFPTAGLWMFFIAAGIAFSLRDFAGSGMTSLGSLFLQKSQGFTAHGTGLALSGIFFVSMISNPLFGRLSDGGRIRWAVVMLLFAFVMVAIFPRLPRIWIAPALMVYGFFFQANYPIVEAAVMESVPDAVRGRVFGLFITMGGMLGNLSHWLMGAAVKRLGPDAALPQGYYGLYGFLALMILLSLAGLPCLHAIRKREGLEEAVSPGMETAKISESRAAIE